MKTRTPLTRLLGLLLSVTLIFDYSVFPSLSYATRIVNNPDGSQTIETGDYGTTQQPRVEDDSGLAGTRRQNPVGPSQSTPPPRPRTPTQTNDVFDSFSQDTGTQGSVSGSSSASRSSPKTSGVEPSRTSAPPPTSPEFDTQGRKLKPSAEDLDTMMKKLLDPSLPAVEKKRITGILFYHQSTYRNAVSHGQFQANSPQVQAFLEQKKVLQAEVIQRMGINYKNKYGSAPKQPIIPFDYNDIFSDDDIITGTGQTGRALEPLYNKSLNEVMRETVGRPMDALDRKRVDVNGLAWNMTQDAAHIDFGHDEKYINPQSGYANQRKLIEGAQKGKVTVYTFDDQGRMIKLSPEQSVEEIKRLAVGATLDIPGIDATRGSGSMSDFLRMAEKHGIRPSGRVTVEEIQQFVRNQKYSQRVIGDYTDIFQNDAKLNKQFQEFIELSNKLREAKTIKEVAALLEGGFGQKILLPGGVVDYDRLTAAMLQHQNKQLTQVLPGMVGEVTKTEAYKIIEWLRTAGKGNRLKLRKQMALTYAPMDDDAINTITKQIDKMPVDAADKDFLKSIIKDDSRQIRRYAELLQIPAGELSTRLRIDGDNVAVANWISKSARIKPLTDAISARPGGSTFQAFLESKTAKALNLDTMLSKDAKASSKFMLFSMMTLAATRAYSASADSTEGLKNVANIMFEMIPFVASALRFSEGEGKLAFKEFCMDVLPPIALANVAVMFLSYAVETQKTAFSESIKDDIARQVLNELTDDDFIKSDVDCYYILKNRAGMLEYLDEVSPGLGKIAKLSSMIEPEIEALMSRHPEVDINNKAIHTLQWFETVSVGPYEASFGEMFNLEQLKSKVYESGVPAIEELPPVQRVAAKLIVDNLRIRKELYYEVLKQFMDRMERLYNEEKEKCDEEWVQIVDAAMSTIKQMHDNAPQKIKDSAFGSMRLNEEYRSIVEYLTNYNGEDKELHAIRVEMQEIIDQFREFIRKLGIAVDIQLEGGYIDLQAHVFGGSKGFDGDDMIILGDRLRVGISARVSPIRRNLPWTVYYYVYNPQTGKTDIVATISLNSGKFNPGNEGLWLIENPEKTTIFEFDKEASKTYFPQEKTYRIRPVLAFGSWSDPLAQVGAAALANPADYPELFSEDRAAFVGAPVEFFMTRPTIYADINRYIEKGETPELKIALRVPFYARDDEHKATISAFSYVQDSKEPDVSPDSHDPVSTDNFDPPNNPSVSRVSFDNDAKEGSYELTVKAEIKGLDREDQPFDKTIIVNYIDKEVDEGEEEGDDTVAEKLEPLAAQINGLKASEETIISEANALEASVKSVIDGIAQKLTAYDAVLNTLSGQLGQFEAAMGGVPGRINEANTSAAQALSDAKAAAALRSPIENETLGVCEKAQAIKNADDPKQIKSLMSAVKAGYSSVKAKAADFFSKLQSAQDKNQQISGFVSEMEFYRSERDRVTGSVLDEADAPVEFEAELTKAGELLEGFSDLQGRLDQIKSDSSNVVAQAEELTAEDIHPNDIPRLAQIKQVDGDIQASNGIGQAEEKAHGYLMLPEQEATKLTAKKDALKQRASEIKASYLPDEVFNELADAQKEASSSYEAATLFQEPVEEALANAKICHDVASEKAQIKTPEQQVTELDCTNKKGSIAQYNRKLKKAQCKCPPKTEDKGDRCEVMKDDEGEGDGNDNGDDGGGDDNVAGPLSVFGGREGGQGPTGSTTDDGHDDPNHTDDDPVGSGFDDYTDDVDDYAGEAGIKDRPKPPPKPKPPVVTTAVSSPTATATSSSTTPPKDPGLTNVTVSISNPVISMWDYGTEDFDTVSVTVNGVVQIASLRLTKSKQTLTLSLKEGVNTLKVTAINIGDPEINKRLNLPPYNAAAITFTHVIQGKSYQQWELSAGQSGQIEVYYQPQ